MEQTNYLSYYASCKHSIRQSLPNSSPPGVGLGSTKHSYSQGKQPRFDMIRVSIYPERCKTGTTASSRAASGISLPMEALAKSTQKNTSYFLQSPAYKVQVQGKEIHIGQVQDLPGLHASGASISCNDSIGIVSRVLLMDSSSQRSQHTNLWFPIRY